MNCINELTTKIQKKESFVFVKFGDGEYGAAVGYGGCNCDGTPYTNTLKDKMNDSFKYISQLDNSYIGFWHHNTVVTNYWNSLVNKPVNWVDYHTFIFDSANDFTSDRLELYRSIRNSKLQKIYVCNDKLVEESKKILDVDDHVVVDSRNWFENDFTNTVNEIKSKIKEDTFILMTSCGMGAKPLIHEIHKSYPQGIYIDLGCATHLLFSKNDIRGHPYSYSDISTYFSNI